MNDQITINPNTLSEQTYTLQGNIKAKWVGEPLDMVEYPKFEITVSPCEFPLQISKIVKPKNDKLTRWEQYYDIDASHPKHIRKLLREWLGQIHNLGVYLLPDNMPLKNYRKSKPVARNIFKHESYEDILYYREFLNCVARKEYKKAYKLYWEMDTFPREFISEQFKEIMELIWNGAPYA